MAFAHSGFAQFMASGTGRVARIIAGLILIGVGYGAVGGLTGTLIAIVGLVPLAAGTLDFCLLTALFGGPFAGAAIRNLH